MRPSSAALLFGVRWTDLWGIRFHLAFALLSFPLVRLVEENLGCDARHAAGDSQFLANRSGLLLKGAALHAIEGGEIDERLSMLAARGAILRFGRCDRSLSHLDRFRIVLRAIQGQGLSLQF